MDARNVSTVATRGPSVAQMIDERVGYNPGNGGATSYVSRENWQSTNAGESSAVCWSS